MARRRYSFSALSGQLRQLDEEQSAFSPREAASAGGDALRLGTIVHAVLAELHPSQPLDVAARVAHHAQAFLEEDAGLLSDARELIERFLTSPRARKLRGARQMHQELEFLLSWPPGESASPSYLHGFIDCLYQDLDDSWHLIDYKTNRVTEGEVFQAVATYEMQMLVYALAVERVLGKPPESAVLYFLRPGCEHAICLDQASRRARTLVDQAIAAANAAANRPSPLAV
jgi:ATP-dependent exoDNAse (exonuclease V) beta subunit